MLKYFMAALAGAIAIPAAAQNWAYAESDRFRVYSEGGEEAARTMAIKLERLDDAMRLFTGVKPPPGPTPGYGKVTLYQFGKSDDIGKLINAPGVYGFFSSRAGDSVAFVPLHADKKVADYTSPGARQSYDFAPNGIDPQPVLFHEYAHYFMYYHRPAAYPMWYSEGFAELFGTIALEDKGFAIGAAPVHRTNEIRLVPVNTSELFDIGSRTMSYPVYGHGWLTVSYLSFNPDRKGQLKKYLTSLNRGANGKQAAQEAFGDLGVLERQLNAYRHERVMGMRAVYPRQDEPKVTVRTLSEAEAAAMPIAVQSNAGVTQEKARGLVGDARRVAARYPTSLPVQLMAVEAEFDAGDFAAADKRAAEILKIHPDSLEAHLYRAYVAMKYAEKDRVWLGSARTHFTAASRVTPDDPRALAGIYMTYRLGDETPPESALIALETAYDAAPFDNDIRRALGHLLLLEKRDADAKVVIAPLAYRPHAGAKTRKLRALLEGLDKGERQPLIDELAPKFKTDRDDS